MSTVVTGEVRLSFVHLVEPYAYQEGQEPKYSTTILIPKTDTETVQKIQQAVEEAKLQGKQNRWNGVMPPRVQTPVYDGDGVRPSDGMPFGDECKGHYVLTASAKEAFKPEIVDANLNKILDPTEIYSGMYAHVCINFYPYAFGGKKGIGCGLGPVQKTRDGECLGGGAPKASDVFSALNTDSNGFVKAEVNPITGEPIAPFA